MSSNQDLWQRRQAAVARGVSNQHRIFADRAENAELWDVDGKRYVDFAGGIAVLNTGHLHPSVVAAVEQQLKRFSHTCFQVAPYQSYIALAERLNAIAPGAHRKKALFLTTGAEAVENAVKIARAYTKRRGVISFHGGYHGRTSLTMAMTGKVAPYKATFGPFPGEIYHVPYPMALHGIDGSQSLKALEALFKADIEAEQVAAIVIEPVQGEGGFYIAPAEFLRELRALCDRYGILLIADEVQTGFARTGKLFAIEHSGVVPDLMTLAKSLAGGFPLSAVVGRAEIMDAPHPGGLGGTYGGNPLACAAGLAVLDVIEQEGLIERSQAIGERLVTRLRALADRFECIGDVRGLGAMVAIELFEDATRRQPAPELTKALIARAEDKGLMLLSCGVYGNVIRILVPLTAADATIDEGLEIIEASLSEVVEDRAPA